MSNKIKDDKLLEYFNKHIHRDTTRPHKDLQRSLLTSMSTVKVMLMVARMAATELQSILLLLHDDSEKSDSLITANY